MLTLNAKHTGVRCYYMGMVSGKSIVIFYVQNQIPSVIHFQLRFSFLCEVAQSRKYKLIRV